MIEAGVRHAGPRAVHRPGQKYQSQSAQSGDTVGRVGGEKFSIFMPGISIEQAGDIGERLCQNIAINQEGVADVIDVTMLMRTVMCDRHTPLNNLMAMAYAAPYRLKAEGRTRMVIWSWRSQVSAGWLEPTSSPAI